MKVLSIDFDYFQDGTKEQLSMYPDGIDLPPELSDIVWAGKYFYYGEKLRKVSINTRLYQEIIRILRRQRKDIPVMITNSHVKCYNFILGQSETNVNLTNVDLHHDFFNDNKRLDCGNWIGKLKEYIVVDSIRWICREISLDVYGFTRYEEGKLMPICIGLDTIRAENFDLLFICRSDPWVPPHLDEYFNDLLKICESHFINIIVEPRVNHPRVLPEIKIER